MKKINFWVLGILITGLLTVLSIGSASTASAEVRPTLDTDSRTPTRSTTQTTPATNQENGSTSAENNAGAGGDDSAAKVKEGVDSIGGDKSIKLEAFIKTIVNILLFILGAVAVVMIVIGGIKYTTSNGDPSSTKSAKDTILYAVIGLVVAILAYAIVNFITSSLVAK